MTGNGIQGNCSLCCCQQSILSLLRSSACVGRHTGKFRIQLRSCQKTVSHRYQAVVGSSLEANMTAEQVIDIINYTGVHHSEGTAYTFLRRLENQFNSACQTCFISSKQLCCRQADGYVTVMTASVHSLFMFGSKAFLCRAMLVAALLFYIVAVHIKAEGNCFTRFICFKSCHDTGLAACHLLYQLRIRTFVDCSLHIISQLCLARHAHHRFFVNNVSAEFNIIAKLFQLTDNHACRTEFRPACFRMSMQISAAFDHFIF